MPEPITLAPQGVAPTPITMNAPTDEPAVNWKRLANLPPFQNYVTEKTRDDPELASERDSLKLAWRYIQQVQASGREQWAFEDYCAWHGDQGTWPNETPTGELK